MKILGLSSHYHDASAALVVDGRIIAAAAEERFSLQKHDPSFPMHAVDFCLQQAQIKASDLDLVVYHEDPLVKMSRTLTSAMSHFPFSLKTFLKSATESITGGLWIKNEISKKLDIHPNRIQYIPHHLSHAAHAFLTSPFKSAAILTIDAVGEWLCTGLFHGKKNETGQISIEPIEILPFPHSLGLVYSSFTAFLGFKVNDGECSTMALAAFGRPVYADHVRQIIQIQKDGSYKIDLSYFDFTQSDDIPITEKFITAFGQPRNQHHQLPFDCFQLKTNIDQESQRYADIAASIQLVLEEAILALVQKIKRMTQEENLCLAGGVALNCVANAKIVDSHLFHDLYIPPDPGDGGGALGAALYASLLVGDQQNTQTTMSPYHGQDYANVEIAEIVQNISTKGWQQYRDQRQPPPPQKILCKTFSQTTELTDEVSNLIFNGSIVGWVQGAFENGPRALGHRSILSNPADIKTAKRLSQLIKQRASFRPYACSILTDDASDVFVGSLSWPSRWMQVSRTVKSEYIEKLKATLHVDHSTRPQICQKEDSELFYQLLLSYKNQSGLGALLNTSFNEKGFPLISSPMDALLMFARTDLDCLVINKTLIWKEN